MSELSRIDESVRLRLELAQSKEYLTLTDVQLLSGYSPSTIRRRIEQGKLKAFQNVPNGKLLFKKKNVQKWLENGARAAGVDFNLTKPEIGDAMDMDQELLPKALDVFTKFQAQPKKEKAAKK